MVEAVFKPIRRTTASFESHNELVLVIYCCITNHPKTSWLQTTTIRLLSFTIFVCQAFLQSTVEMSCLCSLMPGASTGKTEGDSTARGRLLQDPPSSAGAVHQNANGSISTWLPELPHSLLAGFRSQMSQDTQMEALSLFMTLSWNSHSTTPTIITNPP